MIVFHGTECLLIKMTGNPGRPDVDFHRKIEKKEKRKNPISTAWRAQSAENAFSFAAMQTSVRVLCRWMKMAVSGQLCRVAEGLSYNGITLAHRHPPPSQQKWDTCANHVQNSRRAAPFLQGDILDSYKSCTIRVWHGHGR